MTPIEIETLAVCVGGIRKLAKLIGAYPGTVSAWIRGKHKPHPLFVKLLTNLKEKLGIVDNMVKEGEATHKANLWIQATRDYKGTNDTANEATLRMCEQILDNLHHPFYIREMFGSTTRNYQTPFNGDIYKTLHWLMKNNGTIHIRFIP